MRVILVVERKHLFPGLSPQGFLPPTAIDLDQLTEHLFFAERRYMEMNSHYKQIIPYLVLTRGAGVDTKVLAYQRRLKHTEKRLGGRWSVGFGGHVEPLDRDSETVATAGLLTAGALRELAEETGISRRADQIALAGFINSDSEDVSSVHVGAVFRVSLDDLTESDEAILETVAAQAEPAQASWIAATGLPDMLGPDRGPDGGSFEDWSRIVAAGLVLG